MKLYSINTGYFKLDGGAMFGVVPKIIWRNLNPADENNLCNWAMRSLLIEDGKKLILIDTGIGKKQTDKFFSHYFLNGTDSIETSLKKYGFHKSDITDVILTHLHFDHCGGSIEQFGDKFIPAFENATYWSTDLHWNWAINPNEREKASFLKENIIPIQQSGQLKFIPSIKTNHESIGITPFLENIDIRFVYGHTEAMMLPQIQYKNHTILFCADLIPAVAHLPIPYVMAYDMFPLITLHEKKMMLTEAVEKKFILFFEHDPSIECCSIQETDKGIRANEIFKLADI